MTDTTYATLLQLKTRMGIAESDTSEDTELQDKLNTAAEDVESDCGGRVFTLAGTATARIFNVHGRQLRTPEGWILLIDDIGSTDDLVVEIGNPMADSWATITDYLTGPDNAIDKNEPIEYLIRHQPWTYSQWQRIRVTARWGWPIVINKVTEATLLRAHRIARRKDSPEGVAGFNDLGVVRVGKWDPDYDKIIDSLRRAAFA